MFITTVIPRPLLSTKPPSAAEFTTSIDDDAAVATEAAAVLPPAIREIDEQRVRKSLDELGHDIRELQDFLTVTEEVLQRERERDRDFYARERRRKLHHEQHNSNHNNNNGSGNNKENTPVTCPIYSLQSPTYKRPAHPTLRKCKSASPAPVVTTSAHGNFLRLRRRSQQLSASALVTARRQSTMDALQLMVRMQHDLDEPSSADGTLSSLGGGYIAESEFDPDCLRHSDTEDGLDRASTNIMVSSSTDEEDGGDDEVQSCGGTDALEMVVVVKGDGEGKQSCDPQLPHVDLQLRECSAQSNAT